MKDRWENGLWKRLGVEVLKDLISVDRIYIQCCDLNVNLQNAYVEILTPTVMIFRGGAFGRGLAHEGIALTNGILALIKEAWENTFVPSTM